MSFGWIDSILLGIVTGLCEILPVSVQAHGRILLKFMGKGEPPALMGLLIYLAVLAAIAVGIGMDSLVGAGGWGCFLFKSVLIIGIYFVFLFAIGLNGAEKQALFRVVCRKTAR